ncbi:MAG: hypothetical protein ABL955_15170, partial [Elusimicrobiota bacterium]
LTGAVRYLVAKATTDLIKDAEKTIPGLHARLIKDGVVLPDTESSYGGYEDEYDNYGHHGYYGRGGGSSTTQSYREVYKLAHLQSLQAAIDEMGGVLAKEPTKENAAVRELLERATAQIEQLGGAGAKAGMMAGGTAPEAVADQLLSTLRAGDSAFANHSFLRALRAQGLAPASGDLSSQLAYPEALDAAQLAKLRDLLLTTARSGNGWDSEGKPRALTWSEKLYLVAALKAVNEVQAKNFPDAPVAAIDDESLALARLSLDITAHGKDADFALQAEKALIERLTKGPLDASDASQILTQVLAVVAGTEREAAAVKALSDALTLPNGAALAPVARARASAGLVKIGEQAEKAFAAQDLKKNLSELAVREGEYAWRSDLKLRHYRVLGEAINAAAAKASAGGKSLTADQVAARDSAKSLVNLAALAASAGVAAGDTAPE